MLRNDWESWFHSVHAIVFGIIWLLAIRIIPAISLPFRIILHEESSRLTLFLQLESMTITVTGVKYGDTNDQGIIIMRTKVYNESEQY